MIIWEQAVGTGKLHLHLSFSFYNMKIPALAWSCFSIAQWSFLLISLHSNRSSAWRARTVGNVLGEAGKHRKGWFLSHPVHLSRISLKCLFPCLYHHQNPIISSTLPTRSMFTEWETLVLSKNLVLGQTPQSPQHPIPFCVLPVWEWGWLWGRLEVVFPVHICMYIHTHRCISKEWIPLVREVQLRPWV